MATALTVMYRTVCLATLLSLAAGCSSSQAPRVQASSPSEAASEKSTESPTAGVQVRNENPERANHSPTLSAFGEFASVEVISAHTDTAENLRQVSFAADGADFDPALSPDGSMLYFASTAHRTNPDIYVKSIDGRAVTQLTNDPASDVMPAISPDGTRVAFASNRSGNWDIYIMNASGGQAVQVSSDPAHELHPTWSPDGRTLAFSKLGEVSSRWEIWTTRAEQAGVQQFLTYGLFPDWHPTENRIVFQRARDRGDRLFSVWTLKYTKGEATTLTELASSPTSAMINPKWSPDGSFIAFTAVPNPASTPLDQQPKFADVWIMNSNGGALANLTGGRFANLMPSWGPENNVFFVSDRAGRQQIWSSNPEQAILAASGGRSSFEETSEHAAAAAAMQMQVQMEVLPPAAPARAESSSATPAPSEAAEAQEVTPDLANVPIDDRQD